jgi:hypothetical protein
LYTGDALVAGGSDGTDYLATAEVYDHTTDVWNAVGSMSTPRVEFTATALADGRVLVAGGLTSAGSGIPTASAELFDPDTGLWSAAASMGSARFLHAASLLHDGRVLVAAGCDGFSCGGTAEIYDPGSNTWSPTPSVCCPRSGHTLTRLANGKTLVAGSTASPSTSAELFDTGGAQLGGTVLLSGDDADDIGHCQGTACGALYPQVLSALAAQSTSPGSGILAVGVTPGSTAEVGLDSWNAAGNGGPDLPVTIITGSAIASTDLMQFDVLYIPSDATNTQGGITDADLAVLATRRADIENFINNAGGSLLSLTEGDAGIGVAYGWLPLQLQRLTVFDQNAAPTSLLFTSFPGVTTTQANMSHCCYHNVWTGPAGHAGLLVLANDLDTPYPVIIGGHPAVLGCGDGVDTDSDGLSDIDEITLGTNPCSADTDKDTVDDLLDNCPIDPDPSQVNSDSGAPPAINIGEIGNGATVAAPDISVPNSDGRADACDADDDNDGLPDAADVDPRGDATYDDNGNGAPATSCLTGTDGADDGPSWDIDCDGIRDGVIPLSGTGDSDGDGLSDATETRRWGTCPGLAFTSRAECHVDHILTNPLIAHAQDTDSDGQGDCQEVYDTNGDGAVLFPTDGLNAVKATLLPAGVGAGFFGKDGDFDFNGDDALLFPTDGLNGVKAALLPAFCTP